MRRCLIIYRNLFITCKCKCAYWPSFTPIEIKKHSNRATWLEMKLHGHKVHALHSMMTCAVLLCFHDETAAKCKNSERLSLSLSLLLFFFVFMFSTAIANI